MHSSNRILVAIAIVIQRFITRSLLDIHSGHLKSTVFLRIAHRLKSIGMLEIHSVYVILDL